jgi:hypothetical protein
MGATLVIYKFVIFKNHPMGENSPNMVTLQEDVGHPGQQGGGREKKNGKKVAAGEEKNNLGSPIPIFSDSVEQFPRGKFCKIGP